MWIIDHNGTARTEYDGGRKIVVRTTSGKKDDGPWHIIVQGDQLRMPLAYKSRSEAMRQVETWISLKGFNKRWENRTSSE